MTRRRSGRQAGERPRGLARRRQVRHDDAGMTFVELLIVLLITAILIPVTYSLMGNIVDQSHGINATITSLQEDQTAGQALLTYLHGSTDVLYGSNKTTLVAQIEAGFTSSYSPETATLEAQLPSSCTPGQPTSFTTTITPTSGSSESVSSYYAECSSSAFTYNYLDNSSGTPVIVSTNSPTSAELAEIVSVSISVTFLAGPQRSTNGYQSDQPTTFQTTVYLGNATGAPAPGTATVITFPGGTALTGQAVSTVATVSSTSATGVVTYPTSGTVDIEITQGSTTITSCPLASVNSTNGQATCSFTPTTAGNYTVNAAFSGAPGFSSSVASANQVIVYVATSITLSPVQGSGHTLTLTASMNSPVPDGGTLTVFETDSSLSTPITCATQSVAASSTVTCPTWNYGSRRTVTLSATYSGDTTYAASSASTNFSGA